MNHSKLIATGSYLPRKILTNDDLAKMVDTSDEWVVARTGIRSRHIAAENENTSDMALKASLQAIAMAGIDRSTLDLIIVATTTPDSVFPSTACMLQQRLGLKGFPAFDVQAVCSGFMYALVTADCYIKAGIAKRALVVGVDTLSRIIDYTDRSTCVLFGDGGGAAILEAASEPGVIASKLKADGAYGPILTNSGHLYYGEIKGHPYIQMDGQAVFKFAVKALSALAYELLADAGLTIADIDWMIPHQANLRIIEATAQKLGMPMDKVIVTVSTHGNTSAASIPLALDVAVRDGRIKRGDTLLIEGIGAGFTWGAMIIKF